MKILISDYSGHPFQVQLSRELAARGHEVLHVSSSSFQTPKGRLATCEFDPPQFRSIAVQTERPFEKQRFIRRRSQEVEIGKRIAGHVREFRPDVVLSGNAPLDTQNQIQRAARQVGAAFVFWVQDVYSMAISRILGDRLGLAGKLIGKLYQRLERKLLTGSNAIIGISADFVPILRELAGPEASIHVIENWAPLDEMPRFARDNRRAVQKLPLSDCRFIYSGTLGFKHNPSLLLELAKQKIGDVIIFSEGPAAERLGEDAIALGLDNLHVFGWLPFEELPEVLAGADVLITILEPDAGAFAVPSKVLTYMCVGRAQLAAIPGQNLAARLIQQTEAGIVTEPSEPQAFVDAARRLARSPAEREKFGTCGRQYAEAKFDINKISGRFEAIFDLTIQKRV